MRDWATVWRLLWSVLWWSVPLRSALGWALSMLLLLALLGAVTLSGPISVERLPTGRGGCEGVGGPERC